MTENLRQRANSIISNQATNNLLAQNDVQATRFFNVWNPLVEKIAAQAREHFPADHRLEIEFERKDGRNALDFKIQSSDIPFNKILPLAEQDTLWEQKATLSFSEEKSDPTLSGFTRAALRFVTGAFSKSASLNADPQPAPRVLSAYGRISPGNKNTDIFLDPAKMDEAYDTIMSWLALNMAFDFDSDRLSAKTTHQVIISRDSSPLAP